MTTRHFVSLLLPFLLIQPDHVLAEIFRWTDSDGVVHYGESPHGSNAQSVDIPSGVRKSRKPQKATTAQNPTHYTNGTYVAQLLLGRSPPRIHSGVEPLLRIQSANGKWLSRKGVYKARNGEVHFTGNKTHKPLALIGFDQDKDGNIEGPGDLRGFFRIDPNKGNRIRVQLLELIHLSSPVNNRYPTPGMNALCNGQSPALPTKIPLQWASQVQDVVFTYQVARISCGSGKEIGIAYAQTSTGNKGNLDLPPSKLGELYALRMSANTQGRKVARLLTRSDGAVHWEYRFRVAATNGQ